MAARKGIDKKNTLFDEIIKDISENNIPLSKALKGKLSFRTFYELIEEDAIKKYAYAHACETRADHIFDEIIEIADDSSNDIEYTEHGEKQNAEFIARSRLRVDARKWCLSKMNPKKYGEKVDVTTDGKELNASIPAINLHIEGNSIKLE